MRVRWVPIGGALLLAAAVETRSISLTQDRAATAIAARDKAYARIAVLRPHDGDTVDFEAGYIRHLAWHQQAQDTWVWYGWNITFGERQRWFVYASFGHSADSLDRPVAPADDERDNVLNVVPHAEFVGNGLYEYLPRLSRGTGVPHPTARVELTTVDVRTGAEKDFEDGVAAVQSTLQQDTLWYRMIAGGTAPRYVRLRPRSSLSAILSDGSEPSRPENVHASISKMTIEILTLRPTMSLGLSPARE
jgi:hypothetical protein